MVSLYKASVDMRMLERFSDVFRSRPGKGISDLRREFKNLQAHKKIISKVEKGLNNTPALDKPFTTPESLIDKINKIGHKADLKPGEELSPKKVENSMRLKNLLNQVYKNLIGPDSDGKFPDGVLIESDPEYLILAEAILGSLADMNIKWSDMIEDMEYKGVKEREYPIALLQLLAKATSKDEHGNRVGLSEEDKRRFPLLSSYFNPPEPKPEPRPKPKPKPKF